MGNYTTLKKFILAFFILYFVGGLATEVFPAWQDKSMIPFYSWFLFDRVPNDRSTSALRILEYRGTIVEPPLLFQEAKGVVKEPRSPKARELISKMTKSIRKNQKEETGHLRESLEQSFLPGCLRYEIVMIKYDPIERWKTGHYTVEQNSKKEFRTPCPS